jgi:hypothetical protein
VQTAIRALRDDEIDAVVKFSVRAWRPVFESFARLMGPEIFQRVYPDWAAIQASAVDATCRSEDSRVWVADAGGRPAGFVAVVIHDDTETGEVYMIAVGPDCPQGLRKGRLHATPAGPLLQSARPRSATPVITRSWQPARHAGLIVMLPKSELALMTCGDAAFLCTVTLLDPT